MTTLTDDKLPALPEPIGHQIIAYGRHQAFAVRADVADEMACKFRQQSDPEADFRAVFTADQVRQAQREAFEAAVPKWLPITGAPDDGRTLLLGYFNKAGKWRTVRGQWMSQSYIDEYWEDPDMGEPGWFETSEESEEIPNCWPIDPTHYQPLPPAPNE